MTLDHFLFQREQFPLQLSKEETPGGRVFWSLGRIEIPPYHPSMAEEGLPFEYVPGVLEEALRNTNLDLEEIADKINLRGNLLPPPGEKRIQQEDSGISVSNLPLIGRVWVGKKGINPYNSSGDQGISIYPSRAAPTFSVAKEIVFPSELMAEYEMTETGLFTMKLQRIECKHGWYRHNLDELNAIFYRNLVIALDNEVVKKKYGER